MSVYIKGFPLPNNCGSCPLRLAWCRERIYMVTRPERCPIVPVPPHGRLIDADALTNAIEWIDWYHQNKNKDMVEGANSDEEQAWYREQDIYATIEDAPTIIEADDSIKQGEWEKHNDGIMYWWECSKCHHDAWYDGDDLHNYCPWCGAKMTIIEAEGEE